MRRLLGLADAVAVLGALIVTLLLATGPITFSHDLLWALSAVPMFVVVFKLYGLYDRDVKRISHSTVDDLPWLLHASLVGTLLLWVYSKASPMHQLPLFSILTFGLLLVTYVALLRGVVRHVSARVLGAEPALLIGGGKMASVLVDKLRAHPEYRLDIVGSLEFEESDALDSLGGHSVPGIEVIGSVDRLEEIAVERGIGRIVISSRATDDHDLAEVLRRCRRTSLKVSILPKLADTLGATVEVDDVEGVTVLGVNPPWLPRSSRFLKRTLDLTIASVLVICLAPLAAVIALLIWLDSRGPVFFAQERIGKGGRRFRLFKFRTMCVNAELEHQQLLKLSSETGWLKLEHDPRITRVGRRLRRLSLDELPQLLNVIRGDMSLVGPRPLIVAEDRLVEGWARGRLDLTPGITGYWQVLGRTRIPLEEMVKLDYLYVTNWSLWEDLRLILRTLPVVLSGRGAN